MSTDRQKLVLNHYFTFCFRKYGWRFVNSFVTSTGTFPSNQFHLIGFWTMDKKDLVDRIKLYDDNSVG